MLGNIGPMQLLIIFLIVLLIFGTKKLRNVGGDLGSAIRDFRKSMSNEEEGDEDEKTAAHESGDPPDKESNSAESDQAKVDANPDKSKS